MMKAGVLLKDVRSREGIVRGKDALTKLYDHLFNASSLLIRRYHESYPLLLGVRANEKNMVEAICGAGAILIPSSIDRLSKATLEGWRNSNLSVRC